MKDIDKELEKEIVKNMDALILKGRKRMFLVCTILCVIGAIPHMTVLALSVDSPMPPSFPYLVIGWLVWTLIGVAVSPYIVNKLWKD